MHRLIVALLAAVDAAIAVAVGLAATLAPLTLLWVFGFGGAADWSALWPASATVWQFGNLVPLAVALPLDYATAAGIDPAAASFTLSLAPLAFAGFTIVFAARSGARAARADAWITGVLTGTLVVGALAAVVALTSQTEIAAVTLWQAVLFPTLLFAVPALVSAVVVDWAEAGGGGIARLRDGVETSAAWGAVPALIARGSAAVVVGLLGLGALLTATALLLRGGEIVALYETAHLDVVGATVMTLGQLAYLPTLVVWAVSFLAGPGFAIGASTAVSPAGTQVGVIPGIPLLGAIPESTTPWLLLLALLPVALGAFAGWIARSRLVAGPVAIAGPIGAPAAASLDDSRTAALTGLLAATESDRTPVLLEPGTPMRAPDPAGPRAVIALGIAAVSAAAAGILALFASGSLGPGSLAEVGPAAGPVALAIGAEVFVGAVILLLSPRRRSTDAAPRRDSTDDSAGPALPSEAGGATDSGSWSTNEPAGESPTEPIDLPTAPDRLGRLPSPD